MPCVRVDGRPLREVMIDSYEAANTAMALQNNIDARTSCASPVSWTPIGPTRSSSVSSS